MKISKWRRIGSGLLAVAIAMSAFVGVALPAAAIAVGDDGSAEMNEAYAAHESLMPIGPSFNVDTILEWTPESDPDARYSRASIALTDRTGGFVVNPKANPEAKLMLCSLANSAHDTTSAQGTDDFMSWAFNYWQYADSFVYWSGSEEGIICCPTGEFTDAAHTNGVPVVATLGFPWGTGSGYVAQVSAFCQQAEDGSFPVADKLLEVMEYYGFDGYFFNQESYGCSQEIATRLADMMKYMREKCPDILISWYDSMLPSGSVSYQNAVNSYNKGWMEPDETGNYCVDEFFMNYNWYQNQISTTISTMNSMGRSPYAAFAGLDVQQNCMKTSFQDYLLLDENGKMKISFALYCPNSTLGLSATGAQFHEVEQDFYVNTASDPRVEVSDPTVSSNSEWVGMSRFFADKTPITSAPFVTNFNSGHGTGYWVDGTLSRDREWSYQSNQDVMPTWTWIIDSEGSKLSGGYDFTDAYNGGNSIKFEGALDAGKANEIMLYSTDVTVKDGMKMSLTYKNDEGKMKLVAYYGDSNTTSYETCTKVVYDLTAGEKGSWTTTSVDLSENAGKTLYAIGMHIESDTAVANYKVNLGQLTITDKDRDALTGPSSITLDEILYHNAYEAEARVYWSKVSGAASYEVYKVNADGSSTLIMETPNTALYLSTVTRDAKEEDVILKVVPINKNGVRGEGTTLTIDWLYGNEDSEEYIEIEFENVALNATVTGVSFENSGEPASKALDGTSANNSKWCASNRSSGWMSIDIGREVTVRRWRVEHAEYGGEAKNMNTIDFALEYKNAAGEWVQAKRIQNNTSAVTDVLLDEPITASEWKLVVYNDGSSPWGGIRIYEWQMFETSQFPQTDSVLMQFASASNNAGATDTFTLTHVPVGHTVKLYIKSGDDYKLIGEQVAEDPKEALTTVTFTDLDFGTAEAGRVYYTTEMVGAAESIKQSAPFSAEDAVKSAPATNVSFEKYSQIGSSTSANGDDIFTTMTVKDLEPGDVVYVYESNSDAWTKMSLPVAEGETSATINAVRVVRAGGKLTLQVKRVGELISDKYTVDTPAFEEPKGTIVLTVSNAAGETLKGVTYGIYNESGVRVGQIVTSATGGSAKVELGTYTLKCEGAPEGYRVNSTPITLTVRSEGRTYKVKATLKDASFAPTVTSVTIVPASISMEKGKTQQFLATVTGENEPSTDVIWTVEGAASATTAISAEGLLTIGADETAATLTVKATSVQDSTKFAVATVTVTGQAATTENVASTAEIIAYNGNNLGSANGPEKLFDGKWEDQNNDKWCVDGANMWVAFDIGEERDVTELKVYHAGVANEWSPAPGKINTSGYEFFVLDESKISVDDVLAMSFSERTTLLADNSYWTTIGSITDNLEDITTNDLTGTTGRIFKFNVSRTDSTGWGDCVRVYELELYANAPVAEPKSELLSQNATVLGSSKVSYAGEDEAKAFDGKYDTKWCALTPNWLVFDIETPATPDRLKVTHANGATKPEGSVFNTVAFELQMLDTSKITEDDFLALSKTDRLDIMGDSSYWTTIKSYTNNTLDVTDDELEVAKAGRIYRFTVSDGDNSDWQDTIRIYEIELYGIKGSTGSTETVDKSELNNLITEAAKLKQSDYTSASWSDFTDALTDAKTVAVDVDATQAEVDAAVKALEDAIAALQKHANKDALQVYYDYLVSYPDEIPEEYPLTAHLVNALGTAKTVLADDDATQAEVDAALEELKDAYEYQTYAEALFETVAEIDMAIAEGEDQFYTLDSWNDLMEMYEFAQEFLDYIDEGVLDDLKWNIEQFDKVINDLVEAGDSTELAELVAEAKLEKLDQYTEESANAVRQAIAAAEEVIAKRGTQQQINAAARALESALDGLTVNVDKDMLQVYYDYLASYPDELPEEYPLTKQLTDALDAAKSVLDNKDATQDEVDTALQTLKDGYEYQTYAEVLFETVADIDMVIAEGGDKDYTLDSWNDLMEMYESAEEILENLDEGVLEDLKWNIEEFEKVINDLVEAGDSTELAELVAEAKRDDLTQYTDASADAIRKAITAAEEVIAKRGTEDEIEKAQADLEKALENAELKPTEPKPTDPKPTDPKPTDPEPTDPKPTDPEPTEKPTEEPTTKPTEKPSEEPTTKPTEKPTTKPTEKPTTPSTGDEVLIAVPVIFALLSAAAIAVLLKKRYQY